MTNLLIALSNLAKNSVTDIYNHYHSSNRANGMGEALEFYIKDLFCDSININGLKEKNEIYSKYFSYLGNQNNPPDIIIRNGDAIEVKKIENLKAGIALNSSYPKNKLYADNPMITQAYRNCENWQEKDLIYAIGVVKNSKLKTLWFVHGSCYAATKETYERIKRKISSGLNELSEVDFSETKELGRVNKVDPLGITYLRIRGMWHINNPTKVFNYITEIESQNKLTVHALMLKEKYLSHPAKDQKTLENCCSSGLTIKDVMIKSPNNTANLLEAKLIKFVK